MGEKTHIIKQEQYVANNKISITKITSKKEKSPMTNINIEIESELHHKLKIKAVMDKKTLKELIIEKLQDRVRGENL